MISASHRHTTQLRRHRLYLRVCFPTSSLVYVGEPYALCLYNAYHALILAPLRRTGAEACFQRHLHLIEGLCLGAMMTGPIFPALRIPPEEMMTSSR